MNRVLRPAGANTWDVLVDGQKIGRVVQGMETRLNHPSMFLAIRGVCSDGSTTNLASDLRHAGQMVFNYWVHSGQS